MQSLILGKVGIREFIMQELSEREKRQPVQDGERNSGYQIVRKQMFRSRAAVQLQSLSVSSKQTLLCCITNGAPAEGSKWIK